MSLLDPLRSSSENGLARDASVSAPSLNQLRAGDMLDYDGSTWTVSRHERFDHEAGSVDRWTLTCGDDTRLLEHGPGGAADFQLSRRATLADVTVEGQPFLAAMQNEEAPDAVEYRGARYERVETDARTDLRTEQEIRIDEQSLTRAQMDRKLGGVLGGIAAYLSVSSVLFRLVVLLGMLGLLTLGILAIAGDAGWGETAAIWGAVALAGSAYGGALYTLPDASLTRSRERALSHYGLYESGDGVVALECWDDRDWRAYEGRAARPDKFENILPGERRTAETDPKVGSGSALTQLQEGALLDYEGSTWEVIRHTTYEGGKGPIDQWTLQHGADVQVLEYEDDAGPVFRLSTPVNLAEVTVGDQPFLTAVSDEGPPSTVAYQDTEYVLAEEDARMSSTVPARRVDFWARSRTDYKLAGVLGGIAEQGNADVDRLRKWFVAIPIVLSVVAPFANVAMGGTTIGLFLSIILGPSLTFLALYLLLAWSMPVAPSVRPPSHYWRYASDDEVLALECRGDDDWSGHAGREVAPQAFQNVLPRAEDGLLATLWEAVGLADAPAGPKLSGSTALHRLREGYLLDHELQTWTVAAHTKYPYEGWPSDVWTLTSDGNERELEYDREEGGTFRLFEHVPVSDVTVDGTSVAEAVGDGGTPPDEIEYDGTQYVLTEKDARVHSDGRVREGEEDHISFLARSLVDKRFLGACGGIARHLRLPSWLVRLVVGTVVVGLVVGTVVVAVLLIGAEPLFENWKGSGGAILGVGWGYYYLFASFVPKAPPKILSHYWMYDSNEGSLLTLRREGGEWTARIGSTVEPYEFDNILPPSET